MVNGFKCTDMCRLPHCENQADGEESTDEHDNNDELEFKVDYKY